MTHRRVGVARCLITTFCAVVVATAPAPVSATVTAQGFTGQNVHCEFRGFDGVQQRQITVGDTTVTVTFVKKKFLFVAHAETGSGLTNVSHTAMMECGFNAQITSLPN